MRKNRNLKAICLTLVALALVITLNIGNALAYFTNYTTDSGERKLALGFAETELFEDVKPGKKIVWIKNTGEPNTPYDYPCYVRLKAFVGDNVTLEYEVKTPDLSDVSEGMAPSGTMETNGTWSGPGADGYCYYSEYLEPGEYAKPVEVKFSASAGTDSYNVIIIQESTPVLYDNDGNPYADWDAAMNDPTTDISSNNTNQQ